MLRAKEEVKRIQSVPLTIGQFIEVNSMNMRARCIAIPVLLLCALVASIARAHYLCTFHVVHFPSLQMIDDVHGVVSSTAGQNHYVRILSTINRELLKPNTSVALHRYSNSVVDTLPNEADSAISMMQMTEKPDTSYADIGGLDIQKQEVSMGADIVEVMCCAGMMHTNFLTAAAFCLLSLVVFAPRFARPSSCLSLISSCIARSESILRAVCCCMDLPERVSRRFASLNASESKN